MSRADKQSRHCPYCRLTTTHIVINVEVECMACGGRHRPDGGVTD